MSETEMREADQKVPTANKSYKISVAFLILAIILSGFILRIGQGNMIFHQQRQFMHFDLINLMRIPGGEVVTKTMVTGGNVVPANDFCWRIYEGVDHEVALDQFVESSAKYGWKHDPSTDAPMYREVTKPGPEDSTAVAIFNAQPGLCETVVFDGNGVQVLVTFR